MTSCHLPCGACACHVPTHPLLVVTNPGPDDESVQRSQRIIMVALVTGVAVFALVHASTRGPTLPRRATAARLAALAEDDIVQALADEKYAMDISSITEGSELETYVGQGSGVNKGTGIGALAGWVKGLVGRYLSWKNRPVYEKLWSIIEDDLLAMVQKHEPALTQRRTWFSEPGSEPSDHSFATADGKCEGTVAGYKGGRIDWITVRDGPSNPHPP